MKKCKSCQSEIDDKAKKCPNCQSDQRNWFMKHKVLTVILVIILLGMFGSKKTNNSGITNSTIKQEETKKAEVTKVEPMIITAKELADDFDANQVAAEAKWSGKYVEFSAKITNITDYGLSFASVATKDFSMAQISCRINDKQQLMDLKNGQTVKVRGMVGKQTIGVIDVSDCEVVK